MDQKFFWVLECNKGPKSFYAKPDASWTWDRSEAVKFKDWDRVAQFRNEHAELKEYHIKFYDFSDDLNFKDDFEQTEMRF